VINLPTVSSGSNFIVGAERGAERAENRVEWSVAVSGPCRKKRWSGAERGAGGRGAGTEQGAGVTEIG